MAELTSRDMSAKLLTERFERNGPVAETLSDPIADTPMTVTLEQLQPYHLNPRVTRNPRYDDIKSSIRERGLDAPPAITRRPGERHYIIRSGGNTRLAILHELWSETKDERFFRIPSLFRPWSERGEIIALTGHLAENELHGGLSFIERALGVEKARELYEQESGQPLKQTELARRLSADGYPITQPHISRMQDAVRYLLPAIPTVLYGGMGKPQVERLTALRKASARIWEARSPNRLLAVDFPTLFHEVLSLFDGDAESFSLKRVQDELIGQMADLLEADYDSLTLEIAETENRQQALSSGSVPYPPQPRGTPAQHAESTTSRASSPVPSPESEQSSAPKEPLSRTPTNSALPPPTIPSQETANADQSSDDELNARLQGHIVSPAPTSDRLQSIQRLIADEVGDALPDFKSNVLQAIPVQAGGLYPISDVWYIEPSMDAPDRLRLHIAQFAREIADEAGQAERIEPISDGVGFICDTGTSSSGTHSLSPTPRAVLTLLYVLSMGYQSATTAPSVLDELCLTDGLGSLLQGRKNDGSARIARLSDSGLVKLFRLLRLARRLLELESDMESSSSVPTDP